MPDSMNPQFDALAKAAHQYAEPILKECGCTKYPGHPGCKHDRIYMDRVRAFVDGATWKWHDVADEIGEAKLRERIALEIVHELKDLRQQDGQGRFDRLHAVLFGRKEVCDEC